jgi:hypothetical protein
MAGLRRIQHVTRFDHAGTPVELVETIWTWQGGRRRRGAGFRYQTPTSVSIAGGPVARIPDYLMLARLGAVAVTVMLILRALMFRKHN